MRTICVLLLAFTYFLANAQEETLFGNEGLRLTGAWVSAHPGISDFNGKRVAMGGGEVALEFNKVLLIGFGSNRSTEYFRTEGRDYKYESNAFSFTYLMEPQKLLHPKFNMTIGGATLKRRNGEDDKLFVFMPGVGIEVNVFRWFKLGLLGHYRFASNVNQDNLSNKSFSGFLLDFQLRFGWSWGH